MNNEEYFLAPRIFGKNREKLLKLEIQMHMKDYIKEKEMNNKEKEIHVNSTNKIKNENINNPGYYNKYEKKDNFLTNNILTNNIITNTILPENNILTNNIISASITKMFDKRKIYYWLGIPTKYDEMNYYSKWWRFYDTAITMCNILVMLLAIYDYELNFSYPRKIVNDYNTVRILMILLSAVSIFCVLKRHYNKHKWKSVKLTNNFNETTKYNYENEPSSEDDFFYQEDQNTIKIKKRKFLSKGLIIDILVNLIIPYPRLDFIINFSEVDRDINGNITIEYLLSDMLYLMVVLRLFYLIRAIINYSIFSDHYANTIAKERGIKCNIRFALKCMLKTHHIKIVFVFFLASNIILGFALRVFERPFWAYKERLEFEFLTNSIWLIFISMLTIGYGDYVPMTTFGRFIVVLSGLWGVFICSLVVVCLYGLFELSNDQFLVFIKIVKSRTAIKFIEDAYALRIAKFNRKIKPDDVQDNYSTLLSSYVEFKNMRNESKSIYRSNGLLYYNMKLLKEMKKFNQRFDKLEIDIENVVTNNSNFNTNEINFQKSIKLC